MKAKQKQAVKLYQTETNELQDDIRVEQTAITSKNVKEGDY